MLLIESNFLCALYVLNQLIELNLIFKWKFLLIFLTYFATELPSNVIMSWAKTFSTNSKVETAAK